jgi:hypothetical protein
MGLLDSTAVQPPYREAHEERALDQLRLGQHVVEAHHGEQERARLEDHRHHVQRRVERVRDVRRVGLHSLPGVSLVTLDHALPGVSWVTRPYGCLGCHLFVTLQNDEVKSANPAV